MTGRRPNRLCPIRSNDAGPPLAAGFCRRRPLRCVIVDQRRVDACGNFSNCLDAAATDLPNITGVTRRDRPRGRTKEKVMRELVAIASAGAVLGVVAVGPTASQAAVGSDVASNETAAAVEAGAANPLWQDIAYRRHHRGAVRRGYAEPYGCYRWGETGYHWYPFCLGPTWLYPHQRVCRQGYCWYQ
jgi:hypothetical protein